MHEEFYNTIIAIFLSIIHASLTISKRAGVMAVVLMNSAVVMV